MKLAKSDVFERNRIVHLCRVEWKKIDARFTAWEEQCADVQESDEMIDVKEADLFVAVESIRNTLEQVNAMVLEDSKAAELWRQTHRRTKEFMWNILQARCRGHSIQIVDRKVESQFQDFSHLPPQIAEDIFKFIGKQKNIDPSILSTYDYAEEMKNLKLYMREEVELLRETFRFYCVGNTSVSAGIGMSLDEFLTLVSGCKIVSYVDKDEVKKVFAVVCRKCPTSILLKSAEKAELAVNRKDEFSLNRFMESLIWLSCFLKNDVGERTPGNVFTFQLKYIVSNFVEQFGCRAKTQHFRDFASSKTIKVKLSELVAVFKNVPCLFPRFSKGVFKKHGAALQKIFRAAAGTDVAMDSSEVEKLYAVQS
jgi:hypothetical protein